MGFADRLKEAAKLAGVEYSQTAISRALEVKKQTVDRWMADSLPSADTIFQIADRWNLSPRWLATGNGPATVEALATVRKETTTSLSQQEEDLLARFRSADPRWQLSLRLLAALATEEQVEAATDVNVVIARIVGKRPSEVRYAANERVAEAYGTAPHVGNNHDLRIKVGAKTHKKSRKIAKQR